MLLGSGLFPRKVHNPGSVTAPAWASAFPVSYVITQVQAPRSMVSKGKERQWEVVSSHRLAPMPSSRPHNAAPD